MHSTCLIIAVESHGDSEATWLQAWLLGTEKRAEGGIQKWPYRALPQFPSLSLDTRSEGHIAHRAVTQVHPRYLEFCRQNVGKTLVEPSFLSGPKGIDF